MITTTTQTNKNTDKHALIGAEWWCRVASSSCDENVLGFHWDKCEHTFRKNGTYVVPALSTITYISGDGSPTVILDHPAPVGGLLLGDGEMACISYPEPGKHVCFNGDLLHGVPGGITQDDCNVSSCGNGSTQPPPPPSSTANAQRRRVTLIVNMWSENVWGVQHACPIHPLPNELVCCITDKQTNCYSVAHDNTNNNNNNTTTNNTNTNTNNNTTNTTTNNNSNNANNDNNANNTNNKHNHCHHQLHHQHHHQHQRQYQLQLQRYQHQHQQHQLHHQHTFDSVATSIAQLTFEPPPDSTKISMCSPPTSLPTSSPTSSPTSPPTSSPPTSSLVDTREGWLQFPVRVKRLQIMIGGNLSEPSLRDLIHNQFMTSVDGAAVCQQLGVTQQEAFEGAFEAVVQQARRRLYNVKTLNNTGNNNNNNNNFNNNNNNKGKDSTNDNNSNNNNSNNDNNNDKDNNSDNNNGNNNTKDNNNNTNDTDPKNKDDNNNINIIIDVRDNDGARGGGAVALHKTSVSPNAPTTTIPPPPTTTPTTLTTSNHAPAVNRDCVSVNCISEDCVPENFVSEKFVSDKSLAPEDVGSEDFVFENSTVSISMVVQVGFWNFFNFNNDQQQKWKPCCHGRSEQHCSSTQMMVVCDETPTTTTTTTTTSTPTTIPTTTTTTPTTTPTPTPTSTTSPLPTTTTTTTTPTPTQNSTTTVTVTDLYLQITAQIT